MSWKTPPNEEAPKLSDDTFMPVFPISWYCIILSGLMVTKTKVSKDKPRLSVALPEKARNGLRKISVYPHGCCMKKRFLCKNINDE